MQASRFFLLGTLSVVALAGCGGGNDTPTGPSVSVGPPLAVSPVEGSSVTSAQPTLTISNASVNTNQVPTYSFQVATDSGFGNVVAQTDGIPQASGGQTSWTVSPPLSGGQHFWRARARVSATDGPFSSPANFLVLAAFLSREPREGTLVYDPLTNGYSVGTVGGGEFTSQGWKVIAGSNYILYDLSTIENGSVEFDVTGLDIRNPTRDARHLFIMWDPSLGSDFTSNRFRVSLQKLDNRSSISDRWLRLRFITQGRQIDESSTFRGWIPTRVHHIRFEWGREDETLVARLFVDSQQLMFFFYPKAYIPSLHRIELGAGMRAETPENAIYSNVRISMRE